MRRLLIRVRQANPVAISAALAGAALLASTALTAHAGSIVSSDRRVAENGTSFCGCPDDYSTSSEVTSDQAGSFDEGVSGVGSFAFQDSFVGSHEISGSGGVDVGYSGDNTAESRMTVEFTVDQTRLYPISGALAGSPDQNYVHVRDSSGEMVYLRDFVAGVFAHDVALEAGEIYTLEAFASGYGYGQPFGGTWEVALVIPEPGTALLIGLGLSGLAATRRRPTS